jgi:Pyruvate/2-oxoacid:ferredoxin oxidoreductase delta subunit
MAKKDIYDRLCDYYEFQTGPIPNRAPLKEGLRQTVSEEELTVLFLLPFAGPMTPEKLARKAARKLDLSGEKLQQILDHLYQEAFIMKYDRGGGPVYERAFPSFMAEQQVRMRKGTPLGTIYSAYWNDLATITMHTLPTKTPYFRVVPVEPTVTGSETGERRIEINQPITDTREVLPIDVVSEMVRKESLIAVAECYCRLSQGMLGHECPYPKETCFTFNEMAQNVIDIGLARPVSADEAIEILQKAEAAGLVHHADNCQEQLKVLCNCCPCCCPAMRAYVSGLTNVGAPSRYYAVLDAAACTDCHMCVERCPVDAISVADDESVVFHSERCIGCGHCASACPEGAIRMTLRERLPHIERTNDDLWGRIRREAFAGMFRDRVFGRRAQPPNP